MSRFLKTKNFQSNAHYAIRGSRKLSSSADISRRLILWPVKLTSTSRKFVRAELTTVKSSRLPKIVSRFASQQSNLQTRWGQNCSQSGTNLRNSRKLARVSKNQKNPISRNSVKNKGFELNSFLKSVKTASIIYIHITLIINKDP